MSAKLVIAAALVMALGTVAVAGEPSDDEFPNFKFGFSERIRLTSWDNAIDLSDEADSSSTFTRFRTSLSGQWFPNELLELEAKITNEFYYFLNPADRDFTLNETVCDQLCVRLKHLFDSPLTLSLGRQNMMLGEGFVVWDGTPLDGSRTAYFNGARLDWEILPEQMLSFFAVHQPEMDDFLPVGNDQDRGLEDQEESAVGAYFSGRWGEVDGECYYIFKRADASHDRPVDQDVHTFGTRAIVPLADQFTLTAEAALQTGTYGDDSRLAVGGYAYVAYRTDWLTGLPQKLTLGGIYLSGDDPSTDKQEGWEPVFARWPKWSESYIYTLIKENGVAYWTNLASIYARADFELPSDLHLNLDYHHLLAPEKPDPSTEFPGGDGHTRGDLLIGKLSYRINEHTTGHFLCEGFFPGSFYQKGADPYLWVRFELMFRF